jgi:hypothetical protein
MKDNIVIDKEKLASDCIIWTMFKNANDREFWQLDYCEKNCQYRCLKNLDYKKA